MAEVELPDPEELRERAENRFGRRVALAIASLGGNNAMKEMLLAQQQSSDQWAFYQAKVIREHQYRGQRLRLEGDLVERGSAMKPEAREHLQALLTKLDEEEKRYAAEKKDIEKAAKALEHERDVNRDRDPYFDYAEVLLQIAIVLSSVSILSKSRPPFVVSLVLAVTGAVLAVNGFTLSYRLPFFHAGH